MKFRTEISVAPWQQRIEYNHTILCIGSCFASNIAERLAAHKFRVWNNPTGILFNPVSIARSIERIGSQRYVKAEELFESDGRWLSYDFHSSLSGPTADRSAQLINSKIDECHEILKHANHLIITLGTAWAYRLCETQDVVANCHKQPHSLFSRELLTLDQITHALESIAMSTSAHIIITVSPIRHLGEGMEDNSLSKSLLRVAVEECRKRHPGRITYFPSFEIMMDDLRDYRFYNSDLVHPSDMAVDYIVDRFYGAALTDATKQKMMAVERVVDASRHRPQNPCSKQFKRFCECQIEAINSISGVDLQKEKEYFERMLQINL